MRSAAKGLEHRFGLMMGVDAAQIVDMQRHHRVIDKAMEEFREQIHVKLANRRAGEINVVTRPGRPERSITTATAPRPAAHRRSHNGECPFVANRLGEGLAQVMPMSPRWVVRVDMQIAHRLNIQVDQAMAANLVEHMLQKRHAGRRCRPSPSRLIDTVIWVSRVLRVMSA